jgi:uncharacterized protein YlzI (FlbEa/FlbD family)
MKLLTKLFGRENPTNPETIEDLYKECLRRGGKMYIVDENGNTYYMEKVEPNPDSNE